jgi:type IV pilus assembly protein PilV
MTGGSPFFGCPFYHRLMKILVSPRPQKSRPSRRACAPSRARGFSLLEVLISILILSFGLLGMLGMQAAALQANREARMQSTASGLAQELAEMMRGNKGVSLLTTGNPYTGDFSTPLMPATASYCLNVATSTTLCANATAIANAQMTEWLSRVDAELPGAHVKVCVDSAPFDSAGLPQWNCTATGTDATTVIKIGWTRGATDRSKNGTAALDRASVPAIVLPITPGSTV